MIVFGVGSAVAIGAKRVGVPYNVALVVMGLVLVFADVLPHAPLDPEVVLVAFLPVLIFEAALFADADSLKAARVPILALTAPGVLATMPNGGRCSSASSSTPKRRSARPRRMPSTTSWWRARC